MNPQHISVRRILANATALLTSDAMNRATTFAIYALVARRLGTTAFGRLSLALTLFYLFQVFAALGMRNLILREVSRQPSQAPLYLVNGTILVSIASVFSIATMTLFAVGMRYGSDTRTVIFVLSLGLIPYAMVAVCEGVLQALEQAQIIAAANLTSNTIRISIAVLLLASGHGLLPLVLLLAGAYGIALAVEWVALIRRLDFRFRSVRDSEFIRNALRKTLPFVGIDGVIALGASLNLIILAALASEREVGLFSSVTQLMVPVTVVLSSLMLSVSPTLFRAFEASLVQYRFVFERSLEILLLIAVPAAVMLFIVGDQLLTVLFGGDEFLDATPLVRIMAVNLVLLAFTWAMGQALVASMREKRLFRIAVIDLCVNLLLGIVLISQFGIVGAAVTSVIVRLVDTALHRHTLIAVVPNLRLGRLLWQPALGGIAFAAALISLRGQSLVLAVVGAGVVYVLLLGIMQYLASGSRGFARWRLTDAW